MNVADAVMIAEGVTEAEDQSQYIEGWQLLIDTGLCWQLQGWFGRVATELIEEGVCKPFPREKEDVDGNAIHSE